MPVSGNCETLTGQLATSRKRSAALQERAQNAIVDAFVSVRQISRARIRRQGGKTVTTGEVLRFARPSQAPDPACVDPDERDRPPTLAGSRTSRARWMPRP